MAKRNYPFQPPVTCVKCGKELKPLDPDHKDDYGMVDGGIVGILFAPFGSQNDGTVFQIGICDGCIETTQLKPIGDYLLPEHGT